jgi:hypothetical protein
VRKPAKGLIPTSEVSLKDYLGTYSVETITGAASILENSLVWDIFRSYLRLRQREFEVAALDLMNKDKMIQSAAYASGYAKGVEDVAETLMTEFKNLVMQKDTVVRNDPPVEVEPKTEYDLKQ